jgi:predicted nucleic acid-binding protein
VIVVSDTSPISNLIVVEYAHLLPALFGTVIIPAVVYQELLANGSHHPVTQMVQTATWLEVRAVSDPQRVNNDDQFNLIDDSIRVQPVY